MHKAFREKKIIRDKKNKEIRKGIVSYYKCFEGDKIVGTYRMWNHTKCYYDEIYKTRNLDVPINIKGLRIDSSRKMEDWAESKYDKKYKYDLYFSNFTNKKDKLYSNKGHNKGKTKRMKSINNIYSAYFANKDCENDEIKLVFKC